MGSGQSIRIQILVISQRPISDITVKYDADTAELSLEIARACSRFGFTLHSTYLQWSFLEEVTEDRIRGLPYKEIFQERHKEMF